MTLEAAMKEAEIAAKIIKVEMCVVHAPLELANEKEPYGYCVKLAAPILFQSALNGIGKENCPATGIVKTFGP